MNQKSDHITDQDHKSHQKSEQVSEISDNHMIPETDVTSDQIQISESDYVCPICGADFSDRPNPKNSLRAHMLRKHHISSKQGKPSPPTPRKDAGEGKGKEVEEEEEIGIPNPCLLYTSPSPRDLSTSRMPSSA